MSDSLYNRIGGEPAVDAAVDLFYRKVLSDDHINRFFETIDMEAQAAKQKAFLTMVFGGPNSYTARDMRTSHAAMVKDGLDATHFDAVVGHLAATLKELGVTDKDISEVATIAESVRADVLGL